MEADPRKVVNLPVKNSKPDRFTYFEYVGWWKDMEYSHHRGVMSLAVEVRKDLRRVAVGFAFCNRKDRFSRKKGRTLAQERLNRSPIVLPYLVDYRWTVSEFIAALCLGEFAALAQMAVESPEIPDLRRLVPLWAKKWFTKDLYELSEERPAPRELIVKYVGELAALVCGRFVCRQLAFYHREVQDQLKKMQEFIGEGA
jgi:hypothetical protein